MQNLASKLGPYVNILVVDDHSLTRTMVRSILKGVGYQNVFSAENGMAALQTVQSEKIDLIICDWNMPEATGFEVLQLIRGDERSKSIPFLMLTAEAYRENVKAAVEAGVTDYVIKPFTADILIEKVETAFKKKAKDMKL